MAAEAGYQALFTILEGAARPRDDTRKIRRLIVDGSCGLEGFQQTLREYREVSCKENRSVR